MRKLFGWIFVSIPVIHLIGGHANELHLFTIIVLFIMFFGGIAMISSSGKKKQTNDE